MFGLRKNKNMERTPRYKYSTTGTHPHSTLPPSLSEVIPQHYLSAFTKKQRWCLPVPNKHGAVSFHTAVVGAPHASPTYFMHFMRPEDSSRLTLPASFTSFFDLYPGKSISMIDGSGFLHKVRIDLEETTFSLSSGWREFVVGSDIYLGDCLVFKVKGPCCLKVFVFDSNGTQKHTLYEDPSGSAQDLGQPLGEQHVPVDVASCFNLQNGGIVRIFDCLGTACRVEVDVVAGSHFLSAGWDGFMRRSGARINDVMLFEFKYAGQIRVLLFSDEGVQKYPMRGVRAGLLSAASVHANVTLPHENGCDTVCSLQGIDRWVFVPCDFEINDVIKEVVEGICRGVKPDPPLYACRLGFVPIDFGQLSFAREYSQLHLRGLIRGQWRQAYLVCGADDPVITRMTVSATGDVVLSDGWGDFVRAQGFVPGTECLFKFDLFGSTLTIAVYVL
ncbi:hypothetical protein ACP70R_020369 [Stipagrostis hirtigluma subsp. patula]